MSRPAEATATSSRQWRSRLSLATALVAAAAAVAFFVYRPSQRRISLSISAGSGAERRHHFAEILAQQAEERQLALSVGETNGSIEALRVSRRSNPASDRRARPSQLE